MPMRDPLVADLGSVLLVGLGPAAIQLAVDLARSGCTRIGAINRPGERSDRIGAALRAGGSLALTALGQHAALSGRATLTDFHTDPREIGNHWQTVVLCTPADSYREIAARMPWEVLTRVRCVVLLSPFIGAGLLVRHQLPRGRDIDIVSLSNYYAATKRPDAAQPLAATTKAVKKRIYMASSHRRSASLAALVQVIRGVGVDVVEAACAIEAESRNITTYVHSPFFLSRPALDQVLFGSAKARHMYKVYPEGPITPQAIGDMLRLWKELSQLVTAMGGEPVNLLKFLNDDNYPVHEIMLSRDAIESFPQLDSTQQQFLLYVRYTALLVDPFSTPDAQGRFFDFSAVPFERAHQDAQGRWTIPRVPLEDYRKLDLIARIGGLLGLQMPQARALLAVFEQARDRFVADKGRATCHSDVLAPDSQPQAIEIVEQWKQSHA